MTFSGVGKCRQVGISESGIDDAVQKLIYRGYKVGRIEQLETSDQAKIRGGASVIQRKLVQVITPSTVTEGSIGPEAINLLSIKEVMLWDIISFSQKYCCLWFSLLGYDPKNPRCKCNYCGQDYACDTKNGTSSLWATFKKCKRNPCRVVDKDRNLLRYLKGISSEASLVPVGLSEEEFRMACAEMIVLDQLPFSMVEGEGFKRFCSVVQPQLHPPSSVIVAQDRLFQQYSEPDSIVFESQASGESQLSREDVDGAPRKYLQEPKEDPLRENFDILCWWKANSNKYKVLSQVARDILAIPVSTVISKLAFNSGIHTLDPFRSSLSPRMAEALMFIYMFLVIARSGSENGMTVYGFAFVDSASLKFWVGSISDDASGASLGALLMQVSPKEVIYEGRGLSKEAQKALKKYSSGTNSLQLTPTNTDFMDASEVRNLIQDKGYFTGSFGSLGWDSALDGDIHQDLGVCALGGLVSHLSRLMLDDVLRNGDISSYHIYSGSLRIDGQSLANLEIFCNNADGGRKGTMYKYLDSCITSSGKRLLRSWICHPLKDVGEINRRLNAVEEFISHPEVILLVAEYLRKLPDMERLLGRVRAAVGSSTSLLVPLIGEKMLKQRIKCFCSLVKGLRVGVDLLSILHEKDHELSSLSKVLDVPSLNGSDGLDGLLSQFEAAADSEFSNVQGQAISGSDAETLSALTELFIENSTKWYQVIHALSCIDVLRSFAVAVNSSCGSMCRPVFLHASSGTGGPLLKTKGLWHPYASLGANVGTIVPNDIHLGGDSPRTLLLTGPNMGGKSTLLRATCLAVILAQVYLCLELKLGCYVPCEMCMLTPVDIIFTRLGATDRIMTGESTFFIECTETASVLQNATCDSLVILDELGRGTSTFDGYAIAYAVHKKIMGRCPQCNWCSGKAVAMHLSVFPGSWGWGRLMDSCGISRDLVFRHLVENVKCRLLFATHYHSLTKEFASHPNVISQHMACALRPNDGSSSIDDKELIFLYRLSPGACPESYGLQVALMAGISKNVVEVAAKASQWLKGSIGKNFRSSEQRSEFSTLHEEWVKSLLCVARDSGRSFDEDACDTLLCLYHELKNFYQIGN
ncbi:hypothetical protein Syun_011838 [Stephania yunnanensis]|uniref:DNA mismatch repair protein n=1 Tax=Stephania yunnanensis TaxID=152371 RepID=A0AAP0JYA0_9MAGN